MMMGGFSIASVFAAFVALCVLLPHHVHARAVFRSPAVPLITMDPYFQVFSAADTLPGNPTTYWDGTPKQFVGLARVANTTYTWCGAPLGGKTFPLASQQSVTIDATTTTFVFSFPGSAGSLLRVTFRNPLFSAASAHIGNPAIGFIELQPSGAAPMDLYFASTAELATNSSSEVVRVEFVAHGIVRTGTVAQNILGLSGDAVGINWGFLYLSSKTGKTFAGNASVAEGSFTRKGEVPGKPGFVPPPQAASSGWPSLAVSFSGVRSGTTVVASIGYDDVAAVEFFGQKLSSLWTALGPKDFPTLMLQTLETNTYAKLTALCDKTDQTVYGDALAAGGENHAILCAQAYRQALAGTKYVVSPGGPQWLFLKEISSDGDVQTCDVIFPASPVFLMYNVHMLRDLLLPLLVFASNSTGMPSQNYSKPWAPHHLGVWPIANGPTNDEPMPVEESANTLLMVAAIVRISGSLPPEFAPYMGLFRQWADYLQSVLPDPGNQLCTDDFTGPSPRNVNLAAKGIIALHAYAKFIISPSDPLQPYYLQLARTYALYWQVEGASNGHTLLEYGLNDTWSTKYNLFYMELLGLDTFPSSVIEADRAFYLASHMNTYGVPLDNRANFAKSDWLMWMFASASSSDFAQVSNALFQFYNVSSTRYALGDWYMTSVPSAIDFRARPVVGGFFARQLLAHVNAKKN